MLLAERGIRISTLTERLRHSIHPRDECQCQPCDLREFLIQDHAMGRFIHPVKFLDSRANPAIQHVGAVRIDSSVKPPLHDEDGLSNIREMAVDNAHQSMELKGSAGRSYLITLPPVIYNCLRACAWFEMGAKRRKQPCSYLPAKPNANCRRKSETTSNLSMLDGQVQREQAAHRLAAYEYTFAARGYPLISRFHRSRPILPSAAVHIVGCSHVTRQQRAGNAIAPLVEDVSEWADFGGRGRETVRD